MTFYKKYDTIQIGSYILPNSTKTGGDAMDSAFIGVLSAILGIFLGLFGAKRSLQQDFKREGETEGSFRADLAYIKKRTDDVLLEQKDTNRNLSIITERLVRVEESSKSAHRRLDELESDFKNYRKQQ